MEKHRFKIDLFAIGLFLVPFDNLSIAPSSGWATLSPFVFFLYVFCNLRILGKALAKAKWVFIYLTFGMWIQLMLLVLNEVHIASFIDGLATTVLGISFYLSLIIRYQICGMDKNKDGELLLKAYTISFIYGIIRLLVMKYLRSAMVVFYVIEKRPYTRIAFSFTEPSFVSMHIIGVFWLFIYLITDRVLIKKMLILGAGFAILEFLFLGSTRCVMDFGVFFAIYLVKSLIVEAKHVVRNIALIGASISAFLIALIKIPRLNNIIRSGIYSDASGASRWFRVNAAVKGFFHEPIRTLFGYGMGNLIIPLKNGYNEARLSYRNGFINEVVSLGRAEEIDSLFCFPVKLISDWGLIITAFLIILFLVKAKQKHIDIYVVIMTLWLYVQFDSYAFYSLWLLLFIINFYKDDSFGKSYYSLISDALKTKSKSAVMGTKYGLLKQKLIKSGSSKKKAEKTIVADRKIQNDNEFDRLYLDEYLAKKEQKDDEFYRIQLDENLVKRKQQQNSEYDRIQLDENLIKRKQQQDSEYDRIQLDENLIKRKQQQDSEYDRIQLDENLIKKEQYKDSEYYRIQLDESPK